MHVPLHAYSSSPSSTGIITPLNGAVIPTTVGSIDVSEAERHLKLLDPDADVFIFASFDDDKERAKETDKIRKEVAEGVRPKSDLAGRVLPEQRYGTLHQHKGWMEKRQMQGAGIFVTVQMMKGSRRAKDEVTGIRAVFGEMDHGMPDSWPQEPSFINESSDGRYHPYWLSDPEHPLRPDDFTGIMMTLIEAHGSDPSAKDLARVLRLAGTWNLKPGRKPHLVKVIHEGGYRYTRIQLLSGFSPPVHKPTALPATCYRPKFNGTKVMGLERFIEPLKCISADPYGEWIQVGQALHHESGASSAGLQVWDAWSATSAGWHPGVCEQKWRTFNGHGRNGGTIFNLAKEKGYHKVTSSGRAAFGAVPASPKLADGDTEDDVDIRAWPKLPKAALYGLAGEFATLATEHSEADPVAVMMTSLTAIGALMGRARFIRIGDTDHHARLMTSAVGATSRARKGTSWGPVRRLIARAQEIIQERSENPFPLGKLMQITHGPLSTGEGLINAIRDGLKEDDKGIEDKRLLVIEGEYGASLRAMQRQGNTLSMTLRTAWDGHQLAPLIKTDRTVASDPHICIVAHITRHELEALLASSDVWGGLANRFLWVCVRRRAVIPFPKPLTKEKLDEVAYKLAKVVIRAHEQPQELRLTNSAQAHWADVYRELSQEESGLFGAATARAEAQTIRLALTFALIDGSDRIEQHHLEAGLAMWRYAKDSAAYLFGGGEVDPVAHAILKALAEGPKTQTDINTLFARNKSAQELAQVLGELQEGGRVTLTKEATGNRGAPRKVWSLVP